MIELVGFLMLIAGGFVFSMTETGTKWREWCLPKYEKIISDTRKNW